MTARELALFIGCEAEWSPTGDIVINVRITDARMSYGRVLVEIRPLSGYGEKWVAETSVALTKGAVPGEITVTAELT